MPDVHGRIPHEPSGNRPPLQAKGKPSIATLYDGFRVPITLTSKAC
jgi:hypothetical protein